MMNGIWQIHLAVLSVSDCLQNYQSIPNGSRVMHISLTDHGEPVEGRTKAQVENGARSENRHS